MGYLKRYQNDSNYFWVDKIPYDSHFVCVYAMFCIFKFMVISKAIG